jgi:hypothetical protein
VSGLIPAGASVVLLGDGAFDGTRLQQVVQAAGWSYVCRTSCHMTAAWEGETFQLDTLGACSKPGTLVALSEVWFTHNWLQVLDTAERSQVDHRVPQQLHPIVPLLDAFKAE